MFKSVKTTFLIAGAAMLLSPLMAGATMVHPGASATFGPAHDLKIPAGDVIATDNRTVDINYQAPAGEHFVGTDAKFTGTFTSSVIRDPLTRDLSFVYLLDAHGLQDAPLGQENAHLIGGSFAGFTTDIDMEAGAGQWTGSRSADGAMIETSVANQTEGAPPRVAVSTNALNFDRNGTINILLADEFAFEDDLGNSSIAGAGARIILDHTLEPVAGGASSIPLPPGVWTGLIALLAAGVVARGYWRAC